MKINQAGSHLDHMLRQTRMHHIQLSVMADVKANALMTIAAVMLTFSAPFLERAEFKYAVIALMFFSLTTILLAIFAVLPGASLPASGTTPVDMRHPNFNLLFFGSFARLEYGQFEAAMEEMMNDPSKAYEVQVREVYTLGMFLARKKYRLLRYAYFAFTTGLLVAGIILAWSVLFSH
jgi:hypothetical protein